MAGPIEYLAPGNSWVTAWAMTWAVEWRSTWRPASVSLVMMATRSWSCSGRPRSTSSPSTVAATAALASRLPIDDATSPAVVPAGYSRAEPSGREIVIWSLIAPSSLRARPRPPSARSRSSATAALEPRRSAGAETRPRPDRRASVTASAPVRSERGWSGRGGRPHAAGPSRSRHDERRVFERASRLSACAGGPLGRRWPGGRRRRCGSCPATGRGRGRWRRGRAATAATG